MLIRTIVMGLSLTFMAAMAGAQQSAQQPAQQAGQQLAQPAAVQMIKTFASSADVAALLAKAKADRKPDQPLVQERILQLAPYNVNLEYRPGVAPAAVHEHEAELMYVIDGSATIVTGGKLVNETRPNAENLSGTGIEGGTPQAIAKGDFLIVPENTAHWFSAINETLVLMTLHVPRTAPAQP